MPYCIYKICCDDVPDYVYIGSTKAFRERKRKHKNTCTNVNGKSYNLKIYTTIRENGGWDNWRMVIIEECGDITLTQARIKEEEWREKLKANMNSMPCYVTEQQQKERKNERAKEYREENKERLRENYEANKEEINKKRKDYYEANKEKMHEQQRKSYQANKEKRKEYREENKERLSEKAKKYREENKEKLKEKRIEYYQENKEMLREKNKKYHEENKEKISERHRQNYNINRERTISQSSTT
jgi:hypothetical protein